VSHDEDKLIRQLSLLSFLLSRRRPFTAREVQESVEGYSDMSDETFARRFHGDRADLGKVGIEISVLSGSDTVAGSATTTGDATTTGGGTAARSTITAGGEAQVYFLPEEDFRLPAVDFTPAEVRALCLALAALDGRFAYARPLRLALSAILRGRWDPVRVELEQLPVALAPDEDARRAGKQLSKLEEAVTRGKTIRFPYGSGDGEPQERTLDPYSLFLIHGHWYVVGHDHMRRDIRTFRLGRIKGKVAFLTEKMRDFVIPPDYDPDEYRARPPWLYGPVRGTAVIKVGDDLAWWVDRLRPHVSREIDDDAEADGCTLFSVPYADEMVLLSWIVGLGGCGELLEPPALRDRLRSRLSDICLEHEEEVVDPVTAGSTEDSNAPAPRPRPRPRPREAENRNAPIATEHLARAITLLHYLVDEQRPALVMWRTLKNDLGLTREEVEADLALINLVNFGGGTYALTAEAGPEGVQVTRDVMADTFSEPARLSPLMARALLLALDLLGDTLALEGLESLSSVREKVCALIGTDGSGGAVIVDDMLPPDPAIVEVLNHGIRDHIVVTIDYYTTSRQELSRRPVEPYLLFRSPDGWYLEAYCLKADEQRTFKLERIRAASTTGEGFAPRPEVDLARRRGGQAFSPNDVANWATVRFRPRWRTSLEDSGLECTPRADGDLTVRMPYLDERWMAQEIIRYLSDAVLEHPASARRMITESARSLAARYDSDRQAQPSAKRPGGGL
jgi:proteasome accessory factor BC